MAEALIAAAYLSRDANIDGAISAMHKLGIPIKLDSWHFPTQEKEAWMSVFLPHPVKVLGYAFHDAKMAADVLVGYYRGDS